ncbi:MAG: hypothetical protein C0399_03425 [Syntrophus sp. (in: bacteria)]|nr:hypothetical protein [Syntrophus sp. (in: bacteria)]
MSPSVVSWDSLDTKIFIGHDSRIIEQAIKSWKIGEAFGVLTMPSKGGVSSPDASTCQAKTILIFCRKKVICQYQARRTP